MTALPEDHATEEPLAEAGEEATEQARTWLVRLASGAITADELARFEAWLSLSERHRRAFARERAFWQRLDALEPVFARLEEADRQTAPVQAPNQAPNRTAARTAQRPGRPERLRRQGALASLALAACLLLLVFAPDISTALWADYASGDAVRTVTLPDESRVTLNRDSAIRLDFAPGLRRVELLRGEAFFEVEPDAERPFQVLAEGGVSEALGTAYAVRRGEDGAHVLVTEGHVGVTAGGGSDNRVSLRAGEGLRYAHGGPLGERFQTDGARALAWRQGRVIFVDRPLAAALRELERYHAGRILLLGEGQAYRPISGVIDLDRLDQGIAALAATHGLSILQVTPFLTVLR